MPPVEPSVGVSISPDQVCRAAIATKIQWLVDVDIVLFGELDIGTWNEATGLVIAIGSLIFPKDRELNSIDREEFVER